MIRIDGMNLVTVQEAASVLGVSSGRVYHFLRDGRLVSTIKLGRRLMREKDVRRFANARRATPGPKPAENTTPEKGRVVSAESRVFTAPKKG